MKKTTKKTVNIKLKKKNSSYFGIIIICKKIKKKNNNGILIEKINFFINFGQNYQSGLNCWIIAIKVCLIK